MTTASAPIACSVWAVSLQRSPLETLEPLAEKLMTSAREPLGGRLEGDAGAGRVLEEEVDDGLAAQRRQLLDLALLRVGHVLGDVEDARGRPRGSRSSVASRCLMRRPRCDLVDGVLAVAIVSSSRTLTRSRGELGRFLPTKSGRIGSSRWPRSTSTARRTTRGPADVLSASSAARMLRPENSTSSTSTTTLPSMPPAGAASAAGCGWVLGEVVAVHRDVERADDRGGVAVGSAAAILAAMRWARATPRVGMPRGPDPPRPVGLEDLVGDPSQRPGDVSLVEHNTVRALLRLVIHWFDASRRRCPWPPPFPRLTGRNLKRIICSFKLPQRG